MTSAATGARINGSTRSSTRTTHHDVGQSHDTHLTSPSFPFHGHKRLARRDLEERRFGPRQEIAVAKARYSQGPKLSNDIGVLSRPPEWRGASLQDHNLDSINEVLGPAIGVNQNVIGAKYAQNRVRRETQSQESYDHDQMHGNSGSGYGGLYIQGTIGTRESTIELEIPDECLKDGVKSKDLSKILKLRLQQQLDGAETVLDDDNNVIKIRNAKPTSNAQDSDNSPQPYQKSLRQH